MHRQLALAIVALLTVGLIAAAGTTSPSSAVVLAGGEETRTPVETVDRPLVDPVTIVTPEALPAGGTGADVIADLEVIPPPPETFGTEDQPDPGPPAAPEPITAPDGSGVWALVVGINDYPGTRGDLRSAVNDARDFEAALDLFGVPGEQRRVLVDGEASRDAIAGGLDWLTANAGQDSVAVVFYAGHVRKLSPRHEAIIGADGRLLTDTNFARRLENLSAERAWIVMASCFSAGFDEVLEEGRILTAASGADELAYESDALGRSYLVQYLIREAWLEGRAGPSVQDAFAHAVDRLSDSAPERVPVQLDRLGPLTLGKKAASSTEPGPRATETAQPAPKPAPARPPAASKPATPPATQPPQRPAPAENQKKCTLTGLLTLCS